MDEDGTSPATPQPLTALRGRLARRDRPRVVATDVDGTLTRSGRLEADLVHAFARLRDADVAVIPVSGRPAGEVLGLCRYLPGVERGVAENGMVEVVPDRPPRPLVQTADRARLRAVGLEIAQEVGIELQPTADDAFRVVDVAFERDGRPEPALREMAARARDRNLHLIWSSVHIHLSVAPPDKGAGLLRVLQDLGIPGDQVITIGDAPNDAGLFVPGRFAATVGTADVLAQAADFPHLPEYVAAAPEVEAFLELVDLLLQ